MRRLAQSKTMDVGLYLNAQTTQGTDAATIAEESIRLTQAAREAGFDAIAFGQHYLSDYSQLQPVPLLSRLAAEAGSMAVGPAVLLMPFHHPIEIAEQITTIDGFVDDVFVGVGAGYRDVEFRNFGVEKSERVGRLAESIEVMNRLWTEESVTYDGQFHSLTDATINPRPPSKPPVWVAANATAAVERAARIGDAWFVNPHSTLSEIESQKARYDELRQERGLDTAVPIIREAFVAPTTERALDIAKPYLAEKYDRYLQWGQDEAMETEDDLARPFEDLAADRFLLGTPEAVRAEIQRYEETLDVDTMFLRLNWPGMPVEPVLESIELIGDEILPIR